MRARTAVTAFVTLLAAGHANLARAEDDGVVAAAPDPGRDTFNAGKPTWCKAMRKDAEGEGNYSAKMLRMTMESKGFSADGLTSLAQHACGAPDDAEMRAQVARHAQRWVNVTGISEKEARAGTSGSTSRSTTTTGWIAGARRATSSATSPGWCASRPTIRLT